MFKIVELFPKLVYVNTINFSYEEEQYIRNSIIDSRQNMYGNKTSVDSFILDHKFLHTLKQKIQNCLDDYSSNVLGLTNCSLKITQSWANINKNKTSHHTHYHGNSIVSGVLYISENPQDIIFFKDDESKPFLMPMISKNNYNKSSFRLSVQKYQLILFTSMLQHGVDINETETDRVSLAFNSFYSGYLGDKQTLTYLEV